MVRGVHACPPLGTCMWSSSLAVLGAGATVCSTARACRLPRTLVPYPVGSGFKSQGVHNLALTVRGGGLFCCPRACDKELTRLYAEDFRHAEDLARAELRRVSIAKPAGHRHVADAERGCQLTLAHVCVAKFCSNVRRDDAVTHGRTRLQCAAHGDSVTQIDTCCPLTVTATRQIHTKGLTFFRQWLCFNAWR